MSFSTMFTQRGSVGKRKPSITLFGLEAMGQKYASTSLSGHTSAAFGDRVSAALGDRGVGTEYWGLGTV